jgi:serine phosphatase RsbU (regulator of sigma subunit)
MHDPATILLRDPDGHIQRLPFAAERMIVGRTADAAVRIDHALVSRQHAELWRDISGRFHIRDLKSRNGTFVNGQPITDHALQTGDQIAIGAFVLTLEAPPLTTSTRTSTRILLAAGDPGRLSTLKDHEPPRIEVSHLMTLNEFSQKLLDTPNPADRSAALCNLMVGLQFRGQWAVIVRLSLDPSDDRPELLSDAHGGISTREPHLSRSVLRRVRETGEAVLASNMGLPANQEMNVEVSISPQVMAMAAVACPVLKQPTFLDVLYVMLPPTLGSAEWLALVNLAVKQFQQAESAWAARRQAEEIAGMERELERARQIQMRLVPTDPKFAGLELAIGFVPCKWVGGDYVDALKMPDGRTLLTVADVCGKGLAAALVSSSLHTMVHAGVLGGLGPREIMSNLNHYLFQTLPDDSFVTMIAVAIDPATGEIELVNAGHPPAMGVAPGGEPRTLDVDMNMPLRVETAEITSSRLTLAPNELLALYSDGLSELQISDVDFLGIPGLATELKAAYPSPQTATQAVAAQLNHRLNTLQGPRPSSDDRTFLLARRIL